MKLMLTQIQVREDYGILGKLVSNIYNFIENERNMNLDIVDHINLETIPAKDYFKEYRNRFVVRNERLPFDFDVKAAYINKTGKTAYHPILELSVLDFPIIEKKLPKDLGDLVVLKGKSINSSEGNNLIRTLTSTRYRKGKPTRRSDIILAPNYEDEYNVDLAIKVVDSIYNNSIFKVDEELKEKIVAIAGAQNLGIEIKPQIELQQLMKDEQIITIKPQLNLHQKMKADVLSMSAEELQEKIENMNDELKCEILPFLYPIIKRRVISKIKKARPDFSWKQAEQMYKCLVNKNI